MRRLAFLAGLLVSLAACSGWRPMEVPTNSDMKPGPGLFTGSSGAFVLTAPR
ncbi:hypothetical protein [Benzoatithermus flavus]|uniref:Lipoprotein n=1 Tax=Benzoatithermus flavus TaxID=3108223 RepID=A0ABU8XXF3_9PROT